MHIRNAFTPFQRRIQGVGDSSPQNEKKCEKMTFLQQKKNHQFEKFCEFHPKMMLRIRYCTPPVTHTV